MRKLKIRYSAEDDNEAHEVRNVTSGFYRSSCSNLRFSKNISVLF